MQIVRLRSVGRRLSEAGIALFFPGGHRVSGIMWSVEGYLFPQEGVFLYQLGRSISAGRPIVEIGSMRGLSTCCLAAGIVASKAPGRLVSIDPHLYRTEAELRYNLRKMRVDEVVDVRVARAQDVAREWTEEISAVFIDGAHDLPSATQDFETWSPRVRPGGFVLIHDSTPLSKFPGPAAIADAELKVGPRFDLAGRIGSISWARVRGGDGWAPRLFGSSAVDALIGLAKRGRNVPGG
ncbi:MAG TPA: class I SAM-dependent methyltransferase [Candidatus Polarisedimenticolaceae bacterium]|nr:class I SAM-dependent methyltransferase [Candidatus Polarisedimenticolaceae bacterium]